MDKNIRPTQSPRAAHESRGGIGLFIGIIALIAMAIIAVSYVGQFVS